jgi:transcriptional regulator with XRE-family HTH domain
VKKLDTLLNKAFTAEQRREIRRKAKAKVAAIRLQRLRENCQVTQEELAAEMGLTQAALSKLERRPNVTIANLQRYVEALGGRLEIRAVFREETKDLLD